MQIPPYGLKQHLCPPIVTAYARLLALIYSVAAYILESNPAPMTPSEPKFTKRGGDLSG